MKELNPNNTAIASVSVEHIVAKARKEHKRKVSQFKAIQHDIGQYFPNQEESAKLAAEVMKEFNPNERSGKGSEVTVDSIVEKAMMEHKRRKSQFEAIQGDLGLIFDKEDVNAITKDVMKKLFAQKQRQAQSEDTGQLLAESHVSQMREEVEQLKRELAAKTEEVDELRATMKALTKSKTDLAQNANQCLNQMREYLLHYQQSAFKTGN